MEPFSSDPTVLVTGASGFLGSWIVFKLLEDGGYNVRALVHPKIKRSRLNTLKAIFENHSERVEFHKADILEYHDIHNHISGVEYVIHTAAPSPTSPLKPPEENMTEVGITGTINVLKSCISSDVKRVVITLSSSNCTDYIKGDGNYTFSDYTEIHSGMNPFILSKIKTEQEVKEFMAAMNKKTRTFDT